MSENKPDLMAELAEVVALIDGAEGTIFGAADALLFIRNHHARIADGMREAAYGRALREAMEAEYQAAKESRKDGKQEPWITTYTLLRRLKVAADHLSDQAMHNSAREG